MNATLTLSALTFTQTQPGERRETSRGINLPEILTIRHQDYIDSKTKLPGVRSNVRIDRYVAGTQGIVPVSISLTMAVPSDALILSSDIQALEARLVNLIHGTSNTNGLGLSDNIFITKEQ